jgi:hypothetical protein
MNALKPPPLLSKLCRSSVVNSRICVLSRGYLGHEFPTKRRLDKDDARENL